MTDAEIALVLERAADIIEREGYDPDFYGPKDFCDGAYCQVGAIAAAQGFRVSGASITCPDLSPIEAVCKRLHPERSGISAANPEFQRERYPNREAVIRHMREVAASLTGAVDVERERVLA